MPGEQKGKKHKPGAGRPRSGVEATRPVTVWLEPRQVEWLQKRDENVSAAVRALVTEEMDREPR